ncbi:hypothetical protein ACFQS7_09120 [Dankookia sp. GCM10030260]|uniref:hypothetical protein n=1 Tax=Dankookia sp. GCM10030260 TaxID=3273390 RepID=UPI00361F723E
MDSLPTGWLALRHCRLEGTLLPLILLHPALGIAVIGGPPDGPALLRARLAAGRFEAIFPGALPVLRLAEAADPAAAFAALPPLGLPGGDAWVGVVRRALETAPGPAPVAARRSWARHRRLKRRLAVLGGVAGLALLAGVGWVVTLPPGGVRPAGMAGLALPGGPAAAGMDGMGGEALPEPEFDLAMGPDTASPAPAVAARDDGTDDALVSSQVEAAPAAFDAGSPAADFARPQPGHDEAAIARAEAPPASSIPTVMPPPASEPLPPALGAAAPLPPIATALPPVVASAVPRPGGDQDRANRAEASPPVAAAPPEMRRPPATEIDRLAASLVPLPARALPPEPDPAAIRTAAASVNLLGRCRMITQRLQIGEMVAEDDIRLLRRGCQD